MNNIPSVSVKSSAYRALLDAFPDPVFLVDSDVRIFDMNAAAASMCNDNAERVLSRCSGEVLHCIHSTENPIGCGHSESCGDCVVRNGVRAAMQGQGFSRSLDKMRLRTGAGASDVFVLITTSKLDFDGRTLVLLVIEDISEVVKLRRILPICAHCKRVRNDSQYWERLEEYFKDKLDIDFSHSICPECLKTHFSSCADELLVDQPK